MPREKGQSGSKNSNAEWPNWNENWCLRAKQSNERRSLRSSPRNALTCSMRRISSLRRYAKLPPNTIFGSKSWNAPCRKRARSDGLLNSFLFSVRPASPTTSDAEPSQCALNQSMSEGPLDPAHDAAAEVPCDVDGRHLVQVGITDFFGDLLSPSYAVVLAINHELISIGRTFRQHRFVDALDRNAKFRVVQLLLQNHEEVRRLRIKREEVEEPGLPRHEARQRPVGSDPGSESLVGIIARQRIEQVRLIVEKPMFQMDGKRQRMQHQAARPGEVVDHLEGVALIENVLGRAMVGRQTVLPTGCGWHRIEIDVECQRSEVAVDVHAVVLEAEFFVEVARRGVSGPGGIDIDVELLARRDRTSKRLEQAGQQPPVGTPDALRTQFHDAINPIKGSQQLELAIERQDRRTETHCVQPQGCVCTNWMVTIPNAIVFVRARAHPRAHS